MDPVKIKNWENQDWLTSELETKSVRRVGKEQRVSYKLITAWAKRFGIYVPTPES